MVCDAHVREQIRSAQRSLRLYGSTALRFYGSTVLRSTVYGSTVLRSTTFFPHLRPTTYYPGQPTFPFRHGRQGDTITSMTLTELRYVVAVANERHFGRAAEACFVSQPTLSVAVRKLEDELGVTLFERGKGDVRITPVGERVVAQAQRVLEEVSAIKQVARQGEDPLSQPLRLGAIYTVGPYLLPQIVPILHEQAPEMPLLLHENYTAELSDQLKRGELDVIVISLPFDEPGIVTQPLFDEPFVVLLPAGHPWNQLDFVEPEQVARETVLLLGPGHCFRDQVLELCPECGRSATVGDIPKGLEGSSLETIRHMVASGLGITILPCTSAGAGRYSERLVTIRRFRPPAPTRTVALAWRSSFPRREAVEAVRHAVIASGLTCVKMLSPPAETQTRLAG